MKMTHETEVLNDQNAAWLPIITEIQQFLQQAARDGRAVHEVERGVWRMVLHLGKQGTASKACVWPGFS
jgi:hypothetical protein